MVQTSHVVAALIVGLSWSAAALADPPGIERVEIDVAGGLARISVTISHPDTGWDHYADGWRVEDADGRVLGTRILHHPHVDEQPFTRTLSNVAIPPEAVHVVIRARCSVDGWSRETRSIDLSRAARDDATQTR